MSFYQDRLKNNLRKQMQEILENTHIIRKQISILQQILQQEVEELKQITFLELEKKQKLLNKGFVDLEPYNQFLERLLKKGSILEERRGALLRELSLYWNRPSLSLEECIEQFTLIYRNFIDNRSKISNSKKLQEWSRSWEKDLQGIRELQRELKQVLIQLQSLNETNEILIQDRLKCLDYTLSLYTGEFHLEIDYHNKEKQTKGNLGSASVVLDTLA